MSGRAIPDQTGRKHSHEMSHPGAAAMGVSPSGYLLSDTSVQNQLEREERRRRHAAAHAQHIPRSISGDIIPDVARPSSGSRSVEQGSPQAGSSYGPMSALLNRALKSRDQSTVSTAGSSSAQESPTGSPVRKHSDGTGGIAITTTEADIQNISTASSGRDSGGGLLPAGAKSGPAPGYEHLATHPSGGSTDGDNVSIVSVEVLRKTASRADYALVYSLFFLTGLSPWLLVNGVFVEVPILINVLPEKRAISAYLSVAVVSSNVAVGLYFLARQKVNVPLRMTVILNFVIGFVCSLLLGFFWHSTFKIDPDDETMHSLPLLLLVFIGSAAACLCNVTLWPLVARYDSAMTGAVSNGFGFSSLVPALMGAAQGTGEAKPYYGVRTYLWLIGGIYGISTACLLLVLYTSKGKSHLKESYVRGQLGVSMPAAANPDSPDQAKSASESVMLSGCRRTGDYGAGGPADEAGLGPVMEAGEPPNHSELSNSGVWDTDLEASGISQGTLDRDDGNLVRSSSQPLLSTVDERSPLLGSGSEIKQSSTQGASPASDAARQARRRRRVRTMRSIPIHKDRYLPLYCLQLVSCSCQFFLPAFEPIFTQYMENGNIILQWAIVLGLSVNIISRVACSYIGKGNPYVLTLLQFASVTLHFVLGWPLSLSGYGFLFVATVQSLIFGYLNALLLLRAAQSSNARLAEMRGRRMGLSMQIGAAVGVLTAFLAVTFTAAYHEQGPSRT
eukprot:Clim_evm3s69 gene=Clim_evmTU3s69